jgi:hypothetical protein
MSDLEKIKEFFDSANRNGWLYLDHISIYLRKSNRILNRDGNLIDCIDIGAVEVPIEYQNKGYFKKFLSHLEKLTFKAGKHLYVENVSNPILKNYLVKLGYERKVVLNNIGDLCYFKSPKEKFGRVFRRDDNGRHISNFTAEVKGECLCLRVGEVITCLTKEDVQRFVDFIKSKKVFQIRG